MNYGLISILFFYFFYSVPVVATNQPVLPLLGLTSSVALLGYDGVSAYASYTKKQKKIYAKLQKELSSEQESFLKHYAISFLRGKRNKSLLALGSGLLSAYFLYTSDQSSAKNQSSNKNGNPKPESFNVENLDDILIGGFYGTENIEEMIVTGDEEEVHGNGEGREGISGHVKDDIFDEHEIAFCRKMEQRYVKSYPFLPQRSDAEKVESFDNLFAIFYHPSKLNLCTHLEKHFYEGRLTRIDLVELLLAFQVTKDKKLFLRVQNLLKKTHQFKVQKKKVAAQSGCQCGLNAIYNGLCAVSERFKQTYTYEAFKKEALELSLEKKNKSGETLRNIKTGSWLYTTDQCDIIQKKYAEYINPDIAVFQVFKSNMRSKKDNNEAVPFKYSLATIVNESKTIENSLETLFFTHFGSHAVVYHGKKQANGTWNLERMDSLGGSETAEELMALRLSLFGEA